MTLSPTPPPLVSAAELAAALAGPTPPLVLDVRWALSGSQRTEYLAGHVPGAVFCDLDAELAAPPGDGGRHPLPDVDALTATLRRLGVAPGRDVVVLDAGPSMAAARAWWVLRWAGHDAVRMLDGGLAAWTAAGLPVETGDVDPVPAADAVARPGAMPVLTTDDVLAQVAGSGPGALTLLDARPAERFRGDVEPVDPVAGHVPGARSCPATSVQRPDGRLRPVDELRTVLAEVLEEPGPVGASCGSGVSACLLVLALELVGGRAALYPGSWSAWLRDPSRPVATGP